MRIWVNTLSSTDQKDNDCTSPYIFSGVNLAEDDAIALIQPLVLKQAAPLFIERYGEHWLLCNPVGTGRIALLDNEAMSLFALYKDPLAIAQLRQLMRANPEKDIEKVIALFYRTGLLQNTSGPVAEQPEEKQETLTAWLHVTNACNMGCSYCYIRKSKDNLGSVVGKQAVEAVFRSALIHKFKQVKLKYAGGEASLRINEVFALHDYAYRLAQKYEIGLQGVLLSNGVALSQRTIEQLKARSISVTISLDGLGSEHNLQRPLLSGKGSSSYVIRTIDRLLTQELIPFISVTISRMNLAGLQALMRYILDHDLPFSLNYYRENDCSSGSDGLSFTDNELITAMRGVFSVIEEKLPARSLLSSLLDKADLTGQHLRTCGVGQNYLVIDQYGGIAKCQMEIGHTITTVRVKDPLKVIQLDRQGVQGLPVHSKAGCRSCEWRHWCSGGCPALTYQVSGRYDVKSPYCAIYKTLIPEVVRLEARRLLCYEEPLEIAAGTAQCL